MKFRHEYFPSLSLTHTKMVQDQGEVIKKFFVIEMRQKKVSVSGVKSEEKCQL